MRKIIRLIVAAAWFAVVLCTNNSPLMAHTYYNSNCPPEGIAKADAIAKSIADKVMSNPAYKTDLQKVAAATRMVAQYAQIRNYGPDANKYYRTPYGMFVTGNWTCAGSTRALGRVLEFMGFEWTHVNENEWLHQWPVLYMDGQIGYADAASLPYGAAGYGEYEIGIEMVNEAKAARQQ